MHFKLCISLNRKEVHHRWRKYMLFIRCYVTCCLSLVSFNIQESSIKLRIVGFHNSLLCKNAIFTSLRSSHRYHLVIILKSLFNSRAVPYHLVYKILFLYHVFFIMNSYSQPSFRHWLWYTPPLVVFMFVSLMHHEVHVSFSVMFTLRHLNPAFPIIFWVAQLYFLYSIFMSFMLCFLDKSL